MANVVKRYKALQKAEVDAICLSVAKDDMYAIVAFTGCDVTLEKNKEWIDIHFPDRNQRVIASEWIVKDEAGKFSVMAPLIFEETFGAFE